MSLPALTARRKSLLTAALAAVGLGVYYGMVLAPLGRMAIHTGRALGEAERSLRDIEQGLMQEPQLQQQQKDLDARVAQLRATVPTEDQAPSVLQRVTEVGTEAGVKVESLTPKAAPAKEAPLFYRRLPIQFKGMAGFHQLGVFLSRIETEGPPVQLYTLHVSANSKLLRRHDVQMLLVSSLALLAPPAAETAPADAAKHKPVRSKTKSPRSVTR